MSAQGPYTPHKYCRAYNPLGEAPPRVRFVDITLADVFGGLGCIVMMIGVFVLTQIFA
ncbi:hypothetical protein [Methylobacterium sp. 1030]|uniref:hypothetical protein n=1 Tax=Methylobacterium sp. 1030 TaxID=3156404 RepID=UPI00339950B5